MYVMPLANGFITMKSKSVRGRQLIVSSRPGPSVYIATHFTIECDHTLLSPLKFGRILDRSLIFLASCPDWNSHQRCLPNVDSVFRVVNSTPFENIMAPKTFKWTLGLLNNASKKYLTLETFGFKLNVDGVSMKKKQIWTLEQDQGSDICYFRSHLNRYMSADPKGNVKCEEEERTEETKFTVETQASGNWAIKSVYGAYFGGSGDQLKCVAKPSATEHWSIQLAMHPQINVMSSRRTRYAHLDTKTETITATEVIPWGADAMLTLEFDEIQGKYAFVASNKMYLNSDGSLNEDPSKKSLFTIEFHEGEVAFRTDKGNYLAAVGTGKIQAGKNTTVGKDELFVIQDSPPQVSFIGQRDRRLSIHQGMYGLLWLSTSKAWFIYCSNTKLFTDVDESSIVATSM